MVRAPPMNTRVLIFISTKTVTNKALLTDRQLPLQSSFAPSKIKYIIFSFDIYDMICFIQGIGMN